MKCQMLLISGILAGMALPRAAAGDADRASPPEPPIAASEAVIVTSERAVPPPVAHANGASTEPLVRLPGHVSVLRHYYDTASGESRYDIASGESRAVGANLGESELVYSNTPPPTLAFPPGAGRLIADDVTTIASDACGVGGCDVTAYEIGVSGGGDGTGPGFNVDFAIWDGCPGEGGQIVSGTAGSLSLPDDGLHMILVDLSADPVSLDESFWVSVEFDTDEAGWIVGTPASLGFTEDLYHHPSHPCVAHFAGSSLWAGFHIQVYCAVRLGQDIAYLNTTSDGPLFHPGPGVWMADDVELASGSWVLTSYTIRSVGSGGPFTVTAELWRSPDRATLIEGTQGTYQGTGDGNPEGACFSLPDGIEVPADQGSLWVAWKYSDNSAAVIANEAELGWTENLFVLCGESGETCSFFWFPSLGWAGFAITIKGSSEPIFGACCDLAATDGPFCRETTEFSCSGPAERFAPFAKCPNTCTIDGEPCGADADCGLACSDSGTPCTNDSECAAGQTCALQTCTEPGASFDPPCGYSACCTPPEGPVGEGCIDLAEAECHAITDGEGHSAVWQPGEFCDDGPQDCIRWLCRFAEGSCWDAHGGPGCDNPACCDRVCDMDSFCCDVEWDAQCVDRAREQCCGASSITWLTPPAGVIDARQPHPPGDAFDLQGIDSIRVEAMPGDLHDCWTLCETGGGGGEPNGIANIQDEGGGVFTIELLRPITAGAVTTIRYDQGRDAATYISHPGNVNGDSATTPVDLLALLDSLNGVRDLPWGLYSCDLDQSGECGPPDILRLIDLLNGAGTLDVWLNSPLPGAGCPD